MFKKLKYFFKKEIPVLMYHRLINNTENIGIHTIYYEIEKFEEQLKFLKEHKFQTITFKDLKELTKRY